MTKQNKKFWLIGGGLITASIVVSSLAYAGYQHKHNGDYHGKGKGAAMMKHLDRDGDEMISTDEFTTRFMTSFEAMDANGDNAISADEFLAKPLKRFAKFDANTDGFIDQDELPRRLKGHFHGSKKGEHKGWQHNS